jgi:hypothetical protein
MSLVPVVDSRNPWTALRPSVIALAASSMAPSSFFFRQVRPLHPQLRHRLKTKQQPVKTLQQGIVQFSRDAGALADPRLERHLELMMQVPDPHLVRGPQQPRGTRPAQRQEPGGPSREGAAHSSEAADVARSAKAHRICVFGSL